MFEVRSEDSDLCRERVWCWRVARLRESKRSFEVVGVAVEMR